MPGFVQSSPASNDYEPGYAIRLIVKDLLIAKECADHFGLNLELLQKCLNFYEKMLEMDCAEKDFAMVYQYLRNSK